MKLFSNSKFLIIVTLLSSFLAFWPTDSVYAAESDIGALSSGGETRGLDINNYRHVVGGSHSVYFRKDEHAFFWKDGTMTDLGTFGGSQSLAYAINDHDQVVGYALDADGKSRAFLWQNGTLQDLSPKVGYPSVALDINNNGEIVGTHASETGQRSFKLKLSDNTVTDLNMYQANAINDNAQVVGFVVDNGHYRATLWHNNITTQLGTLSGHVNSAARNINNLGHIVGWSSDVYNWEQRAFLYKNGTMSDIGPRDGGNDAFDINSLDQVVGINTVGDNIYSGFVWQNGTTRSLAREDVYTTATSINDHSEVLVRANGKTFIVSVEQDTITKYQQLIDQVKQLMYSGQLSLKQGTKLSILLEQSQNNFKQHSIAACPFLEKAIQYITSLESAGALDSVVAKQLLASAQDIKLTVCSG